MIARVIPHRKTARGVDFFDYDIPEDLELRVGDTVVVPIRNRTLVGIIYEIVSTSEQKKRRSILKKHHQQYWNEERINLLEWFASYYAVSLPTAFSTLQHAYRKTDRRSSVRLPEKHGAVRELIGNALEAKPFAKNQSPSVLLTRSRSAAYAAYTQAVSEVNGHTLLLVPEYSGIDELQEQITEKSNMSIIVFSKPPTPIQWQLLHERLQQDEPCIVIGTRVLLQLPLHYWSMVIMDQEHALAYKQYDQNPRYDSRAVLLEAHTTSPQTQILFASPAPSIQTYADCGSTIVNKAGETPKLTFIDLSHQFEKKEHSLFSNELITAIQAHQNPLLFFNRSSDHVSTHCTECDWFSGVSAEQCPQCGSTRLRQSSKGVAQIAKELSVFFPERAIRVVEKSDAEWSQLNDGEITIATEKILRLTPLHDFNMIGILSIDHLLTYPHYRSLERAYQLVQDIRSAEVPLYLQSYLGAHPFLQHIIHGQYEAFAAYELEWRKRLQRPPINERILAYGDDNQVRVISSEGISQLSASERVDRQ